MGLRRDYLALYRRALKTEYKPVFDSLMETVAKYQDIIVGMDKMDHLFLSVLLEHEKEIIELRGRAKKQPSK